MLHFHLIFSSLAYFVYFSCEYAEKCKPDQVLETTFSLITKSYQVKPFHIVMPF